MSERDDYTHGQMREDIARLESELGLSRSDPDETIGDEIRRPIHAEPGSQADKHRKMLGWSLIVFGLFGVTAMFVVVVLIVAVFGASSAERGLTARPRPRRGPARPFHEAAMPVTSTAMPARASTERSRERSRC